MAEQEQLNIYQKLAKIRKQVEVIQKNKRGYGYTYGTVPGCSMRRTAR